MHDPEVLAHRITVALLCELCEQPFRVRAPTGERGTSGASPNGSHSFARPCSCTRRTRDMSTAWSDTTYRQGLNSIRC